MSRTLQGAVHHREDGVADNYIAELPVGAPKTDDDAFVAPTAVVVGAVTSVRKLP